MTREMWERFKTMTKSEIVDEIRLMIKCIESAEDCKAVREIIIVLGLHSNVLSNRMHDKLIAETFAAQSRIA